MFVMVSVIGSRGLLRHLVHDLFYTKINKMAAFFPLSLVHIVGLRGISLSLFTNRQMVNTRNSYCNGQPSNNNNNSNNNNANLEQLLTTQNQLMQAMLQILNNMQPNQQQAPPPPPIH
jgi:hypothetical protein